MVTNYKLFLFYKKSCNFRTPVLECKCINNFVSAVTFDAITMGNYVFTANALPPNITHNFLECRVCKGEFAPSNFPRIKQPDGTYKLNNLCRECYNSYQRRYYKRKGHVKSRESYLSNRAERIIAVHNRRARKLGAKGTLTVKQWKSILDSYSYRCAYCGSTSFKLHIEHFYPLSLAKLPEYSNLATNTPDNIIPACEMCNKAKSDKPFIIFLAWKYDRLDYELKVTPWQYWQN